MTRGRLRRVTSTDSGQALVFVMLISVLTMLLVATSSMALVAQIRPAKQSLDQGAAVAAAQAGLEDFIGQVNANCPDASPCAWLTLGKTNPSGTTDTAHQRGVLVPGADGTGATQSFVWTVTYAAPGVARVRSTGQVPTTASAASFRTSTLVADFNATPSFNDLEYYTKYETYSPTYLDSLYAPRTVEMTSGADLSGSQLAGAAKPGRVVWQGLPASTAPAYAAHGTGICEDLYYPNGAGPGRGTDTAYDNPLRRALGGSDFAWIQETGTYTSGATSWGVTHNDTCDVAFEPDMVFKGPVYTQDAFLLNDVKNNNKGPQFDSWAYSLWNGVINGVQQAAPGFAGNYYRTYATYPVTNGGGEPEGLKAAQFPIYTTNELDLPADPTKAKPLASCRYTGPTRILVVGQWAYVTSPGTPPSTSATPNSCYQSTAPAWANQNSPSSAGGGVVQAKVPVNNTIIYVQNPTGPLTPSVATPASPVFRVGTSLSVPAASTGDSLAGAWTDDATYSPTTACPLTPADVTRRRNLDCEAGKATTAPKEDVFANLKAAADSVVAGTTAEADVRTALGTALLAQLNSPAAAGATAPSKLAKGAVSYVVAVGAMTTTTTTRTPAALTQADPFLQSVAGGGYTQTVKGWPVTITRYSCTAASDCQNTGAMTVKDLVTGSASRTTVVAAAQVNSTKTFPWFGNGHYNDPAADVTQYSNGYGDAYVEGTLKGSLSVVAEHDVVLTSSVSYSNTDLATTTDGYAFVAGNNVRIYRPLTCANDGSAGVTSPGWCPNDTTGTYTTLPDWPGYPPATQYTDDNAPSMGHGKSKNSSSSLYGAVFALRGCFMVDNVSRGVDNGIINLFGGLYQYHRGVTKVQFQGHPANSSIARPGMTLQYNYDNLKTGQARNGGLRVPWIPTPSGRVGNRTWNATGISTGS